MNLLPDVDLFVLIVTSSEISGSAFEGDGDDICIESIFSLDKLLLSASFLSLMHSCGLLLVLRFL